MSGKSTGIKKLTTTQIEFLKILESFMHGTEYHFPEKFVQLQELYQMAGIHNMTAAVYEQIRKEPLVTEPEYAELVKVFKNYSRHCSSHRGRYNIRDGRQQTL